MSELYIGLMSGTSADGIDAALIDFSETPPNLVATHYTRFSFALRKQILELCQPGENEIIRFGELDTLLGKTFASAVNELLKKQNITQNVIKAIGSHGQTIRHCPQHQYPFTLQIGNPNIIAAETGITTVADFRRKDVAFGGQGAPLVPAFHDFLFSNEEKNRIILNIGGFANITYLPKKKNSPIFGFDTGPGNVLLDAWIQKQLNNQYDDEGRWAAKGKVIQPLLEQMLEDDYFHQAIPKSTGREYFNYHWLEKQIAEFNEFPVEDIQATLCELTAMSVSQSIKAYEVDELLICGGGARNLYLVDRLKKATPNISIYTTNVYGIDPDWVEAMAFAWLAKQALAQGVGNIPSVTGAARAVILGGIYYKDNNY